METEYVPVCHSASNRPQVLTRLFWWMIQVKNVELGDNIPQTRGKFCELMQIAKICLFNSLLHGCLLLAVQDSQCTQVEGMYLHHLHCQLIAHPSFYFPGVVPDAKTVRHFLKIIIALHSMFESKKHEASKSCILILFMLCPG